MFCVTLAIYFTLASCTEIVLLHYVVKEFTFCSNITQSFVFKSVLFL